MAMTRDECYCIHEEISMLDDSMSHCPICGKEIDCKHPQNRQFCCENLNIIVDAGSKRACISCGDVHTNEYAPPNVNLYRSLHLLTGTSVYRHKYYIRKGLLNLKPDSIQIHWSDLNKIFQICALFGNLKTNRIRMPRFNFIF